jgi:hypothetical protein
MISEISGCTVVAPRFMMHDVLSHAFDFAACELTQAEKK